MVSEEAIFYAGKPALPLKAATAYLLSKGVAAWILGLLITSCRIERLFLVEFVEQLPMDSYCLGFDDSPGPQRFKRAVEHCCVDTAPVDLIDKGDILAIGKDERELFVSGREDVIYAVHCAVDDLNVLHENWC